MGPGRGLYCFDWDKLGEDLNIWGNTGSDASYQRVEFILSPSNYVHKQIVDHGDSIHPECIADRKKQEDYLGTLKIDVLMDEQVFNQRKYGEESITYRSRFFTQQVDQMKPSYSSGRIKTNLLEDETGFI